MIRTALLIIGLNIGLFLTLAAQISITADEVELRSQLINGGLLSEKKEEPLKTASIETNIQ